MELLNEFHRLYYCFWIGNQTTVQQLARHTLSINNQLKVKMTKTKVFFLSMLLLVSFAGCDNGEFQVHPAKGTVTCNGKPVSGGSISFTPEGNSDALETGKPASATIASDGTFTLSTYGRFDGAIVGKHRVTYMGSDEEDSEESEGNSDEDIENRQAQKPAKAKAKVSCVQTKDIIIEVKGSGTNDFQIELAQ